MTNTGVISPLAHLNDGHDVGSCSSKLGHIDGEMVQLVSLGPLVDETTTSAHGMDAAKIGCWIQGGIWRFGDGQLWDRSRKTTASFVAGGFQGGIRGASRVDRDIGVLFVFVAVDGLLGVFAFEEAHGEQQKQRIIWITLDGKKKSQEREKK